MFGPRESKKPNALPGKEANGKGKLYWEGYSTTLSKKTHNEYII